MKADSTIQTGSTSRVIGTWRRSSFSGDSGACFEFAPSTLGVAVRDSKLGDASPVLHFTPAEMKAMLDAAKAGEFDDFSTRLTS
ncbi:MAG: DUF397 domain-containing protein [Acidimicrobiales bacterium]